MRTTLRRRAPRVERRRCGSCWLGIGVERGEIDLGGAVEHQPERVGALEHGRRRRHRERKVERADCRRDCVQLDDDRLRPDRAPAACVRPRRISRPLSARSGAGGVRRPARALRLRFRRAAPAAAFRPLSPAAARQRGAADGAAAAFGGGSVAAASCAGTVSGAAMAGAAAGAAACLAAPCLRRRLGRWRRRGRHRRRCCGPRGRCARRPCR